jgi:hypothetical protein
MDYQPIQPPRDSSGPIFPETATANSTRFSGHDIKAAREFSRDQRSVRCAEVLRPREVDKLFYP